jgi:diacylglycerol kinase (ATP)
MKNKKVLLIINPSAGSLNPLRPSNDDLKRQVLRMLPDAEAVETESEAHAAEVVHRALRRGVGIVAGAGGDGTAHHLAGLLAGTSAALGIIPLGTANNIARSIGLPVTARSAIRAIERGRIRAIDLGYVEDRHFIEAAGIGLHATALRRYRVGPKKDILRGIYAVARGLAELEPFELRMKADGREVVREAAQATFSNLPIYGGGFRIAPRARADDGRLDVTLIGEITPFNLPGFVIAVWAGLLRLDPSVRVFRATRVEIDTDRPMPVHVDAETPFETPVTISVKRRHLKFVV